MRKHFPEFTAGHWQQRVLRLAVGPKEVKLQIAVIGREHDREWTKRSASLGLGVKHLSLFTGLQIVAHQADGIGDRGLRRTLTQRTRAIECGIEHRLAIRYAR